MFQVIQIIPVQIYGNIHTSQLEQFWVYWEHFLHSVPRWPVSHLTQWTPKIKCASLPSWRTRCVHCQDWFWKERSKSRAFLAAFQGERLEWALSWGDGPCHWLTSLVGRLHHQHSPHKDTWPSPGRPKKCRPAITKQRVTATWNFWRRPPSAIWISRMMMAWHPLSWQPTTATWRLWR